MTDTKQAEAAVTEAIETHSGVLAAEAEIPAGIVIDYLVVYAGRSFSDDGEARTSIGITWPHDGRTSIHAGLGLLDYAVMCDLTNPRSSRLAEPARQESKYEPPLRQAVCPHDVRGPLRQACHCCGACDHIDFRVTDEMWRAVIPTKFDGAPICLRCFDAFANEGGINYARALTVVTFVGDRAIFELAPVSALDVAP